MSLLGTPWLRMRAVSCGGDGDAKRVVAELFEEEPDGFLSLEPYLRAAGTIRGFGRLFKVVADALKFISEELDVAWDQEQGAMGYGWQYTSCEYSIWF